MNINKNIGSQGQALLVTVLVMVVVLTIGLAVVSQSIVQVKTAADEANSQKAFSAAEAGIDEVLKSGPGTTISNQSLGNSANISIAKSVPITSTNVLLNNGTQVLQDDGADLWLSTYPTYASPYTGSLHFYWGTATGCNEAAIEVSIISGPAPYTISRYAYDPCSRGNNFMFVAGGGTSITSNGQTLTFKYGTPSINVINGLLARVTPLYTNTVIGVIGSNPLPSQGQLITSTGTSGNTQRKVTYFQGYDSVPSELFYSLFSAQ